ncbi:MAG: DoxX family protein [Dehalococcoidia bacterium]|jgi:putative oxidoreductase
MFRSLGLLLLRLNVGVTLMAHGYPKLFGGPDKKVPEKPLELLGPNWQTFTENGGPQAFAAGLEKMDIPYPIAGAYASGITEFFGGLALVLGFKTRLVALPIIANMATAIWKVHWKNGFFGQGGFEFPLSLATGAATLGLTGPGAISVDALTSLCCCEKKDEADES